MLVLTLFTYHLFNAEIRKKHSRLDMRYCRHFMEALRKAMKTAQ